VSATTARLYLDLLKKSLLGELHLENEVRLSYLRDCLAGDERFQLPTYLHIDLARPEVCEHFRRLMVEGRVREERLENLGFPDTMIGRLRLDNIEWSFDEIIRDGIAGSLMECGVWRGGAAVFMRGLLKAHDIRDRLVWVADSFAGPPAPTLPQDLDEDLSSTKYPMLAIPLETVRGTFERYGLLDEQVRFVPGWFGASLRLAPIDKLALLRIDADLYESTWDALSALYDRVSLGGFVIVDDYNCIPACREAVDEFRCNRGVADELKRIDWTGVYWRKSSAS
jgi:O-methyltransferase